MSYTPKSHILFQNKHALSIVYCHSADLNCLLTQRAGGCEKDLVWNQVLVMTHESREQNMFGCFSLF